MKKIACFLSALAAFGLLFAGSSTYAGVSKVVTPVETIDPVPENWMELDLGGLYLTDGDVDGWGADISLGKYGKCPWTGLDHFCGLSVAYGGDFGDSGTISDDWDWSYDSQFVGIYLLFRPYFNLGSTGLRLYLEGGPGVAWMEREWNVGPWSGEDDGWEFSLRGGAGLEYFITDNMALRVGYNIFWFNDDLTEEDYVHGPGAALVFRF